MNTLCNNCGHVELLGHHKCHADGEPVRVVLNHHIDAVKTDIYPLFSCGKKGMLKPVDSAHRKPNTITVQAIRDAVTTLQKGAVDPHETFILGDDYYGIPNYSGMVVHTFDRALSDEEVENLYETECLQRESSRPMFFRPKRKEKQSGIPEVREYYLGRLLNWLVGKTPEATHKPWPCGSCGSHGDHFPGCAYQVALDLDQLVRDEIAVEMKNPAAIKRTYALKKQEEERGIV